MRTTLLCLLGLLPALLPARAQAGQPRDWVLGVRDEGTVINLDVVVPGVQFAIEHRRRFFGKANDLTLRSETTIAYPLTEQRFDVDLRMLALTVGASAGARDTYQNLQLGDRPLMPRTQRRRAADDADQGNSLWGWGEVRVRLSIPFNDYFVIDNINTFREEARDAGTFDWRKGVVHDGDYFQSTTWFYLHHPDWGAFAPILDVFDYEVSGQQKTLLNIGFALVLRPGLFRRNDVMLIQGIFNPWSDHFGTHLVNVPVVTSIGYRIVLDVPSTAHDETKPSYFEQFE